jgi:hypothetical protein
MMKSYFATLLMVLAVALGVDAQIVTSEPSPLQQNSENVVIYYHADQGNKKLINQPASSPEYIPVGGLIFQYANQVTGRWGYENKLSKVTSLWTMPE